MTRILSLIALFGVLGFTLFVSAGDDPQKAQKKPGLPALKGLDVPDLPAPDVKKPALKKPLDLQEPDLEKLKPLKKLDPEPKIKPLQEDPKKDEPEEDPEVIKA